MRPLKRLFASLGYEFRRASPERREGVVYNDLLEALYRSEAPGEARFRAPLRLCVDALGYSFFPHGRHPYTAALREHVEEGVERYEESLLRRYYAEFQPASAAELFGPVTRGPLSDYPPDTHLTPWLAEPVDARLAKTRGVLEREFPAGATGRARGAVNRGLGAGSRARAPGHPLFGPVNEEQGGQELARLITVYESVKARGLELSKDRREDIQVTALRREDDFRFLVLAGKHRIAAASVLGLESATVRLRRPVVIDRRDAKCWPLVLSGIWELDAALAYFDRLFDGPEAHGPEGTR